MNLAAPTRADLEYLYARLPDDEIAQTMAMAWGSEFDPFVAAECIPLGNGPAHVFAEIDGTPYCAGGYAFVRPGVARSWMIGTADGWRLHKDEITKTSRQVIAGLLLSGSCHRIETLCLASRKPVRRWYERGLGLIEEAQHRGYGRNGEDFVLYRLTTDELGGDNVR